MESFLRIIPIVPPTDNTGKSHLEARVTWDAFERLNPDKADYLDYTNGNNTKSSSMIMKKQIKYARFYLTHLRESKDRKADEPTNWVPTELTTWWHTNARQFIDNLAHTANTTAYNTSLSAPALE